MSQSSEIITIITTCMGRLAFLKHTLPNWIRHTSFPIIVVDYSCPEGTSDWIAQAGFDSRVAVKCVAASLHHGRPVFNVSRARNAGAERANGDYLLFLDCDTLVAPGFGPWLQQHLAFDRMFGVVPPNGRNLEIWGALAMHRAAFAAVGRYDESFEGWGCEDMDLRMRLHFSGIRCVEIPTHFISALHHSNDLRVKHHAETDFQRSRLLNIRRLNAKLLHATGRTYREWRHELDGKGVLFQ